MNANSASRYRIIFLENDEYPSFSDFGNQVDIQEEYASYYVVSTSQEIIDSFQSKFIVHELHSANRATLASQEGKQNGIVFAKKKRGPYYKVVHFRTSIKHSWIKSIEALGATYVHAIAVRHIIFKCNTKKVLGKIDRLIQKKHYIKSISSYQPFVQLSDSFYSFFEENNKTDPASCGVSPTLIADFFSQQERDVTANKLKRAGIKGLTPIGQSALLIVIDPRKEIDLPYLRNLLVEQRGLRSLEDQPESHTYTNIAKKIIAGRTVLPEPHGLNLQGTGEILAVADTGFDRGDTVNVHPDFKEADINIINYPIRESLWINLKNPLAVDAGASDPTGHGTHVTGSIIGKGAPPNTQDAEPIEGIAPGTKVIFQSMGQEAEWEEGEQAYGLFGRPDDLSCLFEDAYAAGARVHSNSWGEDGEGHYTAISRLIDEFAWKHKDFLVLFAAGNKATATPGNRGINRYSIGPHGISKNALTVGASENPADDLREDIASINYNTGWSHTALAEPFESDLMTDNEDDIAAFSGRGPSRKDRIKPDVIAPGTFVLAPKSGVIDANLDLLHTEIPPPPYRDHYKYASGSSMSTALVAGCAVLVREFLRKKQAMPAPTAALVKAILIHAAQHLDYRFKSPIATPVANFEQGWGRVALDSVLLPDHPTKVVFKDETQGLRTGESLQYRVNLTEPGGELHITTVYTDSPGPEILSNLNLFARSPSGKLHIGNNFLHPPNVNKVDDTNNVEAIVVKDAEAGIWFVSIVADSVPTPDTSQDFALVISGPGASIASSQRLV